MIKNTITRRRAPFSIAPNTKDIRKKNLKLQKYCEKPETVVDATSIILKNLLYNRKVNKKGASLFFLIERAFQF